MDYLPLPDNVDAHLPVPFLSGPPYDNKGFFEYPTRQGWNVEKLRQGDILGARTEWKDYTEAVLGGQSDVARLSDASRTQLLVGAFVQNWLLYAIFQIALQRDIAPHEAICDEISAGGKQRMSTRPLFRELVSRRDSLAGADGTWLTKLTSCLQHAAWVLRDLDELGECVIPEPTSLALSCVIDTIHWHIGVWFDTYCNASHCPRWLKLSLKNKGWCISRIKTVETELGSSGLYYASIIPSSSSNDDGADHTNCIESVCVACNVPIDSTYIQRHEPLLCPCSTPDCPHTHPQCLCVASCHQTNLGDQISEIVLRGDVPLILVKTGPGDQTTFDVIPAEEGAEYVAISHVWYDGRGNPCTNMLPACQAAHMNICVRKFFKKRKRDSTSARKLFKKRKRDSTSSPEQGSQDERTLFWIDTLCVPVAPRDARNAAIMAMHKVYSNAAVVLVMTAELAHCAVPRTTDEALIQIVQSKWMTRLWTMQEGMLAKELAFQFRDDAVNYEDLADRHLDASLESPDLSHAAGVSAIVRMQLTLVPDTGPADRLLNLWYAVRNRTTSRPSDQAVCAGILCKLDLEPILAAAQDGDSRMAAFWQQFADVPLTVLWNHGPRFQTPTLRWAPQSLLDPRTDPPDRTHQHARVTTAGLRFSGVEALAFPDIALPSHDDILVEFHAPGHATAFHFVLRKNVGNPSWQDLAEQWTNIALLWEKQSKERDSYRGVLVSMATPHGGAEVSMATSPARDICIDARWLAQILVLPVGGEFDKRQIQDLLARFSKSGSLIRETQDVMVQIAQTQLIGRECEWCLS